MSEQLEQLEKLLEVELENMLAHTKADYGDVQDWAQKIAHDTITVIQIGYTGAPAELVSQALLCAEVSRIRLGREMKTRLKYFLRHAIKVAVTLL